MVNQEKLPSRDTAFDLLKKLKVPYQVRRHSLKVAEKALELAYQIKKTGVDLDLVEIGALLHDIGRSKTHGFNHAIIGGEILRDRGYPRSLSRICETHILGGLDKEDARLLNLPEREYLPVSIEEKIICLADKLTAGSKEVTIDQRFQKWFIKFGKTKILMKSKKRIERIQEELYNLM
ncbi:MAG: HDIG domain-containing protein [Candidatus Lokiarchaeota archaeon]|jgi:uncharacterized protein